MKRLLSQFAILALIISMTGCRAGQLKRDQDHIRRRVLDLQTEQIMDNLIRAYNGKPMLHMDYSSITGTISQNANGGLGGSQTSGFGIQNFISWSLGGSQNQQLTITADPVIDRNEIYDAYLQFIEKEGRFVVSYEIPPMEAVHIYEFRDGLYYWVPIEYRYDFLRLALVTSVQRGQPLSVPVNYETKIERVVKVDPPRFGTASTLTLQFQDQLPNDEGTMSVTIRGKLEKFVLNIDPDKSRGENTNQLRIQYSPDDEEGPMIPLDEFIGELAGKAVTISLNNYQPSLPTTEKLLESLNREMRLFRLNQASR